MPIDHALDRAFRCAHLIGSGGNEITKAGEGFGEAGGSDTEIAADAILAREIRSALLENGPNQTILIEGHEPYYGPRKGRLTTVDPLDGSLNFMRRGASKGLPYCTVLAEYPHDVPAFAEYSAAGVVDLRNGDRWKAVRGAGTFLNGKPCRTSGMKTVDKKAGSFIIADFYYPSTRETVVRGFSDFRGYMRTPGAAGYELSLVASGSADAFISTEQKCDVLGAAYALITEAGGVIVDLEGSDIGARPYRFDEQLGIIAAATPELARDIVARLKR